MTNRRSYLDSMNAGRMRRASTSLEQLSNTLDELEKRIVRPQESGWDDRPYERTAPRYPSDPPRYDNDRRPQPRDARTERHHRSPAREEMVTAPAATASDLRALRDELRHQMSAGLRNEFAALKTEIDRAIQIPAPAPQAAALGEEFDRLSTMIHKLAEKSDDRQVNLLRRELDQVQQTLGKLAREETVQSFDRRWDEMDRRWSDLANQVSNAQTNKAGDTALQALSGRLEQIADSVNALPTSLTLRSLEEKMKLLASTVDQFAHHRERIGPEAIEAIEERLDEISRAVAASSAAPHPTSIDPEPFERIEARISSLARQMTDLMEESHSGDLSGRLESLSRRVEDVAFRVDLPGQAVEKLADRIETISRKLDDTPQNALTGQLDALSRRVEDIAFRVELPDQTVERLAGKIESISRKLEEGTALPDLGHAFTGLESRFASLSEKLEQRHEDALSQGRTLFRDLEHRLADVTERINVRDTAPVNDGTNLIEAMDARFSELASRLEKQQTVAPPDTSAIRSLEARLEAISSRIEASVRQPGVDPEAIRNLETQIAGLASHMSSPMAQSHASDDLKPRLDKIERSIVDSRQDVLEAARWAAEEAVRSFKGAPGDSELVVALAEDLKSLESLSRRSDERNAKTFEAIHDTLLKIVDRLGAVESNSQARSTARGSFGPTQTPPLEPAVEAMPLAAAMLEAEEAVLREPVRASSSPRRTAASAAAAEAAAEAIRADAPATAKRSMLGGLARALSGKKGKDNKDGQNEAASAISPRDAVPVMPAVEIDAPLDPQLANQPLEPGSGTPDLNAIMKRVRDERGQPTRGPDTETAKSDFIAAARRAAQAAAAEAEMMKRSPSTKAKSSKLNIGGFLKNGRKPVLMGVAAVLMALAAFQFGKPFLSGGEKTAAATPPAPIVSEVTRIEQPAPAVPAATTAAADEFAPVEGTVRSAEATDPSTDQMETATAWLDTGTLTPLQPGETAEAAEIELQPEPSEEVLAAIPADAGPAALREAAATGDPKALYEIGHRYAEGRGVPEDMAKASGWYEKAAENGLAPAQYRIGNLYEKGIGVERNLDQAKTWYQLAAAQGNASAMHNLAVLYAMGADGATDNETAARWFQEAADLGVKDSQFNLGILSAKGVGMAQNLEEAYKWFALVAKAGDKDASDKRDEIANALRPEQLERARAATDLWRAKTIDAEANTVEVPESWSESADTTATVDMRQAVRNIQDILNKNGYQAGTADGVMGQKTKNAIAAFQKDNGMPATGEIDEPLVRALLEKR